MVDYFSLAAQHPGLFSNNTALLKIVLDRHVIQVWQAERRRWLAEQSLPLEWAEIGVILDDPYNIVLRDLVEFPNGNMSGYMRSVAAAGLNGGRGVVVLAVYQGKVLLLHQYRHPTRQWHYEIPRGYGEPSTSAAENARKEIEEEIGGVVDELVSLGEFYNNTGYEALPVSLFYARLASVGCANVNEGIESFVWLSTPEMDEWIANEKITDGFTIAAYTKAKLKGWI